MLSPITIEAIRPAEFGAREGREGGALGDSAAILALALATTFLPVVGHLAGQPVGLALSVALSFVVANYVPAAVPATLLSGFLFQNLALSFVSPWIDGPEAFDTARGYNFVSAVVIWAVTAAAFWTGPCRHDRVARPLMFASGIVLGLVVAYFALGATTDFRNAAVYLRNVSLPFLVFQACLSAARRAPESWRRGLPAIAFAILAYGYLELLARRELFGLIDGDTYMGYTMQGLITSGGWVKEMHDTGRVIRGIDDVLTFDLLNSPLLSDWKIRLLRLQGPNFHGISFAYALAVLGLVRLSAGKPLHLLLALPLLVVIGSKGALVVALFGGAAALAFRATGSRLVLPALALGLALFTGTAILVGLAGGDYHVLGLFGGLKGFLTMPIGRGLGIGGNLATDMTRIDWSKSQALGGTDLAVESALGTILYQMGVAGLAVFATPFCLAGAGIRAMREGRGVPELAGCAFALVAIGFNGVLQEEALFAPLAFGAATLLAGACFGEAAARSARPEAVS